MRLWIIKFKFISFCLRRVHTPSTLLNFHWVKKERGDERVRSGRQALQTASAERPHKPCSPSNLDIDIGIVGGAGKGGVFLRQGGHGVPPSGPWKPAS